MCVLVFGKYCDNFCTSITTVYTTAIYRHNGDFITLLRILHVTRDSTPSLVFSRSSSLQP
jgi:hypothetical protein